MKATAAVRRNSAARLTTLGGAALGTGALAYIGLNDPHRIGAPFPPCPFRMLTGWYCPGCGGLRMTYDVMHLDLASAVADNLLLLLGIPALALWWLARRLNGRRAATPILLAVVVVVALVWTVVRNLPGFPLVPTLAGP